MITFHIEKDNLTPALKGVELKLKTIPFIWAWKSLERIREKSFYLVPIMDGYLQASFFKEYTYTGEGHIVAEFGYRGENPKSKGYDYSFIQHENDFNHPLRGQMKYLHKGIWYAESDIYQDLEKKADEIFK